MSIDQIKRELGREGSKQKARLAERFFKTGKGEYGEGDMFIGVSVPKVRLIVKKYYKDIPLCDVSLLLSDKIHEVRLCALLILVTRFTKSKSLAERKELFDFYMRHSGYVNNWDLVDTSARFIVGEFLFDKPKDILFDMAHSESLWKRRIAIVATHAFILKQDFYCTKKIAALLLTDKEDLLHKATGWMLREMGKKSKEDLVQFLDTYASVMPRTMLRYSIEKMPEKERKSYLKR